MSHLVPRVDAHAEGLWGSGLVSSHSKYDYTNLHTIHEHLLTYCKDRSHLDLQYLRVNGGHSVLPSDLPVDCFPKDTHCSLILLALLFRVQLLLATDNFSQSCHLTNRSTQQHRTNMYQLPVDPDLEILVLSKMVVVSDPTFLRSFHIRGLSLGT